MALVPPFDEDEKNLEEVVKHNTEKGDWDISIPYPIPGFTGSLSKAMKHAQQLAIRGHTIVSDLLGKLD